MPVYIFQKVISSQLRVRSPLPLSKQRPQIASNLLSVIVELFVVLCKDPVQVLNLGHYFFVNLEALEMQGLLRDVWLRCLVIKGIELMEADGSIEFLEQ